MAVRVSRTPRLPGVTPDLKSNQEALNKAIWQDETESRNRLNGTLMKDGTEDMEAPLPLWPIPTVDLPDAAEWEGTLVWDTTALAFAGSNGTGWGYLMATDDGFLNYSQIESISEARVMGRAVGAGTGVTTQLTGAQVAAIIGSDISSILPTATTSVYGAVQLATTAEVYATNSSDTAALTPENIRDASQGIALTESGGTIAIDWDAFVNGYVVIDENSVVSNPSNGRIGVWRTLLLIGNNATPRTVTFGTHFGGEPPTITDVTSTKWYLVMMYFIDTGHVICTAMDASPP